MEKTPIIVGTLTALTATVLLLAGGVRSRESRGIQGEWRPATAELAGRPMPDAFVKSISLKLEGGKYEVYVGKEPDRGVYTLDLAARPRGITVTGTDGPNNGRTFPAIFELKGDTLRICYDLSGKKRPTEFKSVAGTRLYLVEYVRKPA